MRIADFDYDLPERAIAQEAIEPRHAARLLITATMQDRRFSDLPDLLGPGDLLVVNRTRVRAARIRGVKPDTGGAVELLLLRRLDPERWEALARPARRLRPGTVLRFGAVEGEVLAAPRQGLVTVRLDAGSIDLDDLLPTLGEVPLPPYFRGVLDDPERYQTLFAKSVGSAAAPTAALHFTPQVVAGLRRRGVAIAEVELDVGLDTFRPMSGEDLAHHEMHRERFRIPEAAAAAVAAARRRNGRVVAVGTTVVRTLESMATDDRTVAVGEGETGLFIVPGYTFGVVDVLVTNFHAPRTTLIALVAAAIGPRWREVYEAALARRYRFLSFGDAMLIDPVGGG